MPHAPRGQLDSDASTGEDARMYKVTAVVALLGCVGMTSCGGGGSSDHAKASLAPDMFSGYNQKAVDVTTRLNNEYGFCESTGPLEKSDNAAGCLTPTSDIVAVITTPNVAGDEAVKKTATKNGDCAILVPGVVIIAKSDVLRTAFKTDPSKFATTHGGMFYCGPKTP